MEFVIETAGERQEVENALAIITDTWRDVGIKLIMRPLDRDILRNRVYAGISMLQTKTRGESLLPPELSDGVFPAVFFTFIGSLACHEM